MSRTCTPPAMVPVPVAALMSLLTAATVDDKTTLLTYPAWHGRACAHLTGRTPDDATVRLSLLAVDIDHLGQLNATAGHAGADVMLRRIGALRHVTAGENGFAGRFGGDEFVVLLPHTDAVMTRATAETLRSAVARLDVAIATPDGPRHVSGVTVSIGIATCRDLDDTTGGEIAGRAISHLPWAADNALYTAKRRGRDRVHSTQDAEEGDRS